jgi:hypothetical protein
MTQTNAKGSYASSALPAGIYKISVVENGKVKSNVTIQMAASRPRVDFNLKPSAGANVKLYVLVPGAGTHLPAHWVEADANGTPIARGSNMDVASAALAQDMLRRQTNNTGR